MQPLKSVMESEAPITDVSPRIHALIDIAATGYPESIFMHEASVQVN